MESSGGQRQGSTGFLSAVFGVSSMITAWVFVTGWSYLHTYYAFFGININSLDVPVSHFLVFCFTQFVSFRWTGVGVGLLIVLVFVLVWVGAVTHRKITALLVGMSYLFLVWLGFRISYTDAKTAALRDMSKGSPLPRVLIEVDTSKPIMHEDVQAPLESSDLRLLLETKDRVYVFVPVDSARKPTYVQVLEVNQSNYGSTLRIVRVQ